MKRMIISLFVTAGFITAGMLAPASVLASNDSLATGKPTSQQQEEDQEKDGEEESASDAAGKAPEIDPGEPEQAAPPSRVERPAPESRKGPPVTQAEVERGHFTTGIKGREPVDTVTTVNNTNNTVFFFTEIRDGRGQTVTHEWWHDGELIAEVPFNIGGNRWRVWSSKDMLDTWTGEWKVRVVDDNGNTLVEEALRYTEAPESAMDAADEQAGKKDRGKGAEMSQDKGKDKEKDKARGAGDDRADKKSGNASDTQADEDAEDESGDEGDMEVGMT